MTTKDHKTTLGERIFSIRTACLENRETFASSMGVSKNTLVYYEKDERVPGADFLNNIVRMYPRVNPAWLLTGEGLMRREDVAESGVRESKEVVDIKRADRSPVKQAAVSYIDGMTDIEATAVISFIVSKQGAKCEPPAEQDQLVYESDYIRLTNGMTDAELKEFNEVLEERVKQAREAESLNGRIALRPTGT